MLKSESRPETSRHDVLDALRGFALFGIFFANIPFFAGWLFVDNDAKLNIAGAELYDSFMLFFIDGRFYTIFSFLFGLGFALQLSRLQAKASDHANYIYLRRLGILLIIGLLHHFVFWAGDILTLYAVLGFALFFVRHLSDTKILYLAAAFFLVPVIGYWAFWTLDINPSLGLYELTGQFVSGQANAGSFLAGFYEVVYTTDLLRFFELNTQLGTGRIGYYFDTWRIPKVFAVMLLGMWAGRRLVTNHLFNDEKLINRTIVIGLIIGLPSSIAYSTLSGLNSFQPHSTEGYISVIAYTLAVFPLGFAYIALFVKLWNNNSGLLKMFASPGRMALTNYLMQTVLGISIFYGIGFGLAIQYGPASFVLIAILIFVLQVILSNIWLKHFQFGPVEWLWRVLTYGQWFKLKR
ncbi:DUF418 domain-containing protein [Glaciecola sp. XM2]|uniref:DUF418 domain-containing protein n=1 Tax=Glaciecola sp. XM2 TaxID=1914931 RepID=UPI001BDF06B6|nr:DUF418 domain-containing protein [Glaciecola sp. XM2]MBT1449339.1 DUF418 domain-containing protein [Glaciecola sp. XM2]